MLYLNKVFKLKKININDYKIDKVLKNVDKLRWKKCNSFQIS